MSIRPVQVVVWGLGNHARTKILPALQRSTAIQLRGVCSRSAAAVIASMETHGCLGWTDAAQMLSDEETDVVYVSTPIGLHVEHGAAVLRSGKHLWCEKPITGRSEDVEHLLEVAERQGLAVGEAFMYLYHPQFLDLAEVVRTGRLGRLRSITCRFGIPELDQPGFRLDAGLGGGAFLDVGSYPISALTSLIPDSDPDVLFAEIEAAAPVNTRGMAVLGYKTGVRAILEWGTNCAYRNEIDLWGEAGSFSMARLFSKPADYVPRYRALDLRGAETLEFGCSGDAFALMFDAFLELAREPAAAARERTMIRRRASLLEKITQAIG